MIIYVNKKQIVIDDADYALVNYGRSLGVRSDGRAFLCRRVGRKKKTVLLHRHIMDAKPGEIIDHINGNPLDNRRQNLRLCTHSQNAMNRSKANWPNRKILNHGFKGIIRHSKPNLKKPWYARIQANGLVFLSRRFEAPHEAARAYDELAKKYHGEFARLNFE